MKVCFIHPTEETDKVDFWESKGCFHQVTWNPDVFLILACLDQKSCALQGMRLYKGAPGPQRSGSPLGTLQPQTLWVPKWSSAGVSLGAQNLLSHIHGWMKSLWWCTSTEHAVLHPGCISRLPREFCPTQCHGLPSENRPKHAAAGPPITITVQCQRTFIESRRCSQSRRCWTTRTLLSLSPFWPRTTNDTMVKATEEESFPRAVPAAHRFFKQAVNNS